MEEDLGNNLIRFRSLLKLYCSFIENVEIVPFWHTVHDFIAQFLNRAKREDGESDTELESVYGEEEVEGEPGEDLFTVRPDDVPLMNSTMISSVSMTSDPQAASKLNALQDELSSLRQQIAMLVINQEQINRSQCRCHA